MRYTQQSEFDSAVRQAQKAGWPLTLIVSRDEEEAKALALQLCAHWKETQPRFLQGESCSDAHLRAALFEESLFGHAGCLIVERAEKLKKAQVEAIASAAEKNASRVVALAAGLRGDSPLFTAAERVGAVFDLSGEKPWERQERYLNWLCKRAHKEKKAFAQGAAELLLQRTACHFAALESELQKLICFVGERNQIAVEEVKALCPAVEQETSWQWCQAVLKRHYAEALHVGRRQMAEGVSLQSMLAPLRTQFQTSCLIESHLRSGLTAMEIQRAVPQLKWGGKALTTAIDLARSYGRDQLQKGLLLIHETDLKSRTAALSPETLLEMLVARLTVRGALL